MIRGAQFGGGRSQRAEQPVGVAINAGGEEKGGGVGRVGLVSATVIELEPPQAVDGDRIAGGGIEHLPEEATGNRIKCGDGPAETVANQQIVAEETKILGRESYAPRGAQNARDVFKAAQKLALVRKNVDEAALLAAVVIGVVPLGVLLRVRVTTMLLPTACTL